MAVHSWFRGKILEIEPAPNSHIHEIDFMENQELYKEFHDDMTSTGTVDVASYDTWCVDNDEGFQIPLILLQLPDDFEGKDTTDENLKLKPKWCASRRCATNRSSR